MLNVSQVCVGIFLSFCFPVGGEKFSAADGATFCQLYVPIYWAGKSSKHPDSRRTIEQIDTMNRQWRDLCQGNHSR